jgi:hypothetical protein
MSETVELVRPYGIDEQYHRDRWVEKIVTVLLTQRKTLDITMLCVESLLRFYPDIQILAVDGDSGDDSTLYLRWKEITVPNFKLWERKGGIRSGNTSHGETMHLAITNFIATKYVLLLDSDIITERGGIIEHMLTQLASSENLYATGTLMEVSNSNDAVGAPKDENDILRYAHPSFSIYNADLYKQINVPFSDHGSPCVYNMQAATKAGYDIGYAPTDKYVSHLSGASWTTPRTVWNHDFGVFLRPFITFIVEEESQFKNLPNQTSNDFEVITALKEYKRNVILHENLIEVNTDNNKIFGSRFNIRGEYVSVLDGSEFAKDLVYTAKLIAIDQKAPDEFSVGSIKFYRRKYFQNKIAFQSA